MQLHRDFDALTSVANSIVTAIRQFEVHSLVSDPGMAPEPYGDREALDRAFEEWAFNDARLAPRKESGQPPEVHTARSLRAAFTYMTDQHTTALSTAVDEVRCISTFFRHLIVRTKANEELICGAVKRLMTDLNK